MPAWDEGGEIVGWVTAGREWWVSEPHRGTLVVAVDPGRRGARDVVERAFTDHSGEARRVRATWAPKPCSDCGFLRLPPLRGVIKIDGSSIIERKGRPA